MTRSLLTQLHCPPAQASSEIPVTKIAEAWPRAESVETIEAPELSSKIQIIAHHQWKHLSAQLHVKPPQIGPVLMKMGPHPQLTIQLAGGMHLGVTRKGIRRSYLGLPGTVYLATDQQGPWELDWQGQANGEEVIKTIQLDLDIHLLRRTAAEAGFNTDCLELLAAPCVDAPLLQQLGYSLAATLATLGPDDTLYGDTVAHMLAAQLVYQHSEQKRSVPVYRGSLAPTRLRLIQDYVEDSLSQPITLDSLAAVACMSPYHFCRIFKQSTGLSPNQYVIGQRISRARHLLRHGGVSIAQVARAVGYQSAGHFARLFQRHTGVLPNELLK